MMIKTNVENVMQTITNQVIVAATKYVGPEKIRELFEAGIVNVGENRVNRMLEMQDELRDLPLVWHFIGNLQSNKVKLLSGRIEFLHSLDRISLAEAIQKHFQEPLKCFIEVHISSEDTKSGVEPENAIDFCENLAKYDKIQVVGLMGMAPYTNDQDLIYRSFHLLEQLRDKIRAKSWKHAPCNYLSMGMSNDYQIAIQCHATHLRLGRILFRNGD